MGKVGNIYSGALASDFNEVDKCYEETSKVGSFV